MERLPSQTPSVYGDIPAPAIAPKENEGLSCESLAADPHKPANVRDTPPAENPPVPIKHVAAMTPKDLEGQRKILKKQRDDAKAKAFSSKGSETERMKSVQDYHALKRQLVENKAVLKQAKRANSSKADSRWLKVKKGVSHGLLGVARTSGSGRTSSLGGNFVVSAFTSVTDSYDLAKSTKNIGGKLLDMKHAKALIKEGEKKLKDPNLSAEERETIENGIKLLTEHIEKQSIQHDATHIVTSATHLAHSASSFVFGVTKMATLLSSTSQALPVVGQVAGAITIPLGAALAVDSLVAVKGNLQQVNKDRAQVKNANTNLTKARHDLVSLRSTHRDLREAGAPETLVSQMGDQRHRIATQRKVLKSCERQLLAGNLTKAQIAELKKNMVNARIEIGNAMTVAMHLLDGKPEFARFAQSLKAKQVAASSNMAMQETMVPFLEQRLKTKQIGEWVRGAGETLSLASTGFAAAGFVGLVANGAGAPLLVAAAALGFSSTATIYGGGFLVNKIRKMQLGKDRISTAEFNEKMISQLQAEVSNWQALEDSGLAGQSTASAMFEMMKKHYPAMPKSWGPKEWAESLVNDAPKGPERKRFRDAQEAMLYHDSSKGIIGGITKKVVGKIEKKLTQSTG